MTGTQRRAASIALIGLVSTQLTQTLADSRSPLVVSTAVGSFLALAGVISTPGLSQMFGCTPIDPLGWGQAFLATGVASLLSLYAPAVLERLLPMPDTSVVNDDDADLDQNGVDLPDHRGEQSRPKVDKNLRSGKAGLSGHKARQDPAGDHKESNE
jgi:Ca2+-transporting ATPase